MKNSSVSYLRKPLALLGVGLSLFAAQAAFAQTAAPAPEKKDETVKLDKFIVTGSFIPQATAEPIAPVAIFTEADIRSTGAVTPVEALRSLPSFVGNPGATEFDSNGGDGSTFVSLRGLGAGQTLTLINGRSAGNFANLSLIPIEAIDRIEVLRDGAGIIYGSSAIGGAVNIILKKKFTGLTVDVYGGGTNYNPGNRDTFQSSFVAGASNDKTSVVISGSFFKNNTVFASQRTNSAQSDNRPRGGTNGGSTNFAGVMRDSGGGNPLVLKSGFDMNSNPTRADYIALDTNAFSSNQLFNFRQFSPSAPGQKRNSFYSSFDHKAFGDKLTIFGSFLYAKLTTSNGLAPAPFALSAIGEPGGPDVGSLSSFGPYNQGKLVEDDNDFFQYRSVSLGNRTQQQVYNDYRYQVGARGDIVGNWKWETTMTVDNENFVEKDGGVADLVKLDAQTTAGNFNPFVNSFSVGNGAVVNSVTNRWNNPVALKAASITARQVYDTYIRSYDARVSGTITDLPAGPLGIAAGYDRRSGTSDVDVDDLYTTGGVLGLNSASDDHNEFLRTALYGEIKVPLISEANKIPFVKDLSIGALARKEEQTLRGTNNVTKLFDQKSFSKVNPSVNLQYSPTDDYKIRATYSKGFLAPGSGSLFSTPGQNNPTIADPLGFPYTAQTTIVQRGNPDLKPAVSKAWSIGVVGTPKNLLKGFTFSIDFYNIKVDGIIASNFGSILALNAAGQGAGFVAGNAATINPAAPFADRIRRSANGRLNGNGSFATAFGVTQRGAVLSDLLNIASREVTGIEYTTTYTMNTKEMGRLTFTAAANEFIKFDQGNGPGVPIRSYLGKFISTVGDPISPGSIPKWKGNFITRWNWKNINASVTLNYIASYEDDPLFVMSPKMKAFFDSGVPKSDPAFLAFLSTSAALAPKVGGIRTISAWTTVDAQISYEFSRDIMYLSGTKLTLGSRNLTDKLAPFAAGAFNDSYDTRTHNNIGRFVYLDLRKEF